MVKLNYNINCLNVLLFTIDSLAFGHDSREILTCHDVRPMKRFGANRALGVWYGFISRANSDTAAKSCLKVNLISTGNNTLNSEESYVE